MRRLLKTAGAVLLTTGAVACGDSNPRPPERPPSSDTITGRERIGWTQPAPNASELAAYRYAIYVDGARGMLEGETCATTAAAAGFECSAPLPALAPGRRTLEIAVVVMADGVLLEGPRSAPLQITVGTAGALAGGEPADGPLTSSDGHPFQSRIIARDLLDPVDLALAPDGRAFVAERRGRIRVVEHDGTSLPADRAQDVLADLGEPPDASLLSIAVAPEFDATGHLFFVYLTPDRNEARLHIGRARSVNGRLGEFAVVASFAVPAATGAVIRAGAGGHLYVGVAASARTALAQDLSSVAGKILRLNADGSTPERNPWSSPIFSVGHRDTRGLAWDAAGLLWAVDRDGDGDELNQIRAGANYGFPLIGGSTPHPFVTPPLLILPRGTDAAGLAVAHPASPLAGDLVAGTGTGDLLRLRVDSTGHAVVRARLLQGRFGRIVQVAAATDGDILFLAANPTAELSGRDLLVRLTPEGAALPR